MLSMIFLAFAIGADAHTIAIIVFIVAMIFWLFAGVEWTGGSPDTPAYRRIGGGLIPWLAVATLAYLTL